MKNLFVLLSFVLILAASCKHEAVPNPENPNLYGATMSEAEPISFNDLAMKLDQATEVDNIKVKAKVESVCQAKGCWMNIMADGEPDKTVFVKFQDYGFFVPKDIAGMEVVLEGKAYLEETSVDELRHYAEDEGKTAEEIAAINEPVQEMKFMATGVEVIKK
jgi:hypothetical protein